MAHARYTCIGIAAFIMLSTQGPCLADFEPSEALHVLYEAAEHACEMEFGENHVVSDEQDRMKYYCQRLQHPIEFLQDQGWWKQHLPANFQAAARPKELSPGEKRLQEFEKRNQGALLRCKLNGGSDFECSICIIQNPGLHPTLPGVDRTIDPKCRRLFYSHQEYQAFELCKSNGGADRVCATCAAAYMAHSPTCRPYLVERRLVPTDAFDRCHDIQCRICTSSPVMARKPECAAYR